MFREFGGVNHGGRNLGCTSIPVVTDLHSVLSENGMDELKVKKENGGISNTRNVGAYSTLSQSPGAYNTTTFVKKKSVLLQFELVHTGSQWTEESHGR